MYIRFIDKDVWYMVKRQPTTAYTEKYAKKRQAVRVVIDFYLDDPEQKQLYEQLRQESKGKVKQVILNALKQHYEKQ